VNPGIFDVLHYPTDDAPGSIGDGVDVRLEGILQKAVDQDRVLGGDPHHAAKVALERRVVVHDFHGASAQHV
jgi:hypothetical protein